jgi:hypothetical protein
MVHAECVRALDRVAGPRGRRFEAALSAVLRLEASELVEPGSGLESLATRIYPAKAEDGGPAVIEKLADHARRSSPTEQDVPMVFLAMFLLGVGVLHDPRYAWLGRLLAAAPPRAPARQQAVLAGVRTEITRALVGA